MTFIMAGTVYGEQTLNRLEASMCAQEVAQKTQIACLRSCTIELEGLYGSNSSSAIARALSGVLTIQGCSLYLWVKGARVKRN